jgi:type IV pilus assembly protein PilE
MDLRHMPGGRAMRGFSLMEVMIAVVIVGILAEFALPQYRNYVNRGRIIDATARLSDFRVQMEQYFMDNRSYRFGANCGVANPALNAQDSFQITCVAVDDRTYTATAAGIAGKGMGAFSYTINQANAHRTTGLPGGWDSTNSATCWVTNPNGSC